MRWMLTANISNIAWGPRMGGVSSSLEKIFFFFFWGGGKNHINHPNE